MSQTLLDKIGEDVIGFISAGVSGWPTVTSIRARQLKQWDWCAYIVAEDFPNEGTFIKSEKERFVKEHMSGRRINIARDFRGHVIFAETRKELIKKVRKGLSSQFIDCTVRYQLP